MGLGSEKQTSVKRVSGAEIDHLVHGLSAILYVEGLGLISLYFPNTNRSNPSTHICDLSLRTYMHGHLFPNPNLTKQSLVHVSHIMSPRLEPSYFSILSALRTPRSYRTSLLGFSLVLLDPVLVFNISGNRLL